MSEESKNNSKESTLTIPRANDSLIDLIDSVLVETEKEKKEMIAIYWDADVAKVLKDLANSKKGSKSKRSAVVNTVLRKAFTDKGWIK